jgi:hypothetical protein
MLIARSLKILKSKGAGNCFLILKGLPPEAIFLVQYVGYALFG